MKISDHTTDKERKRGQGIKEYLESHPEVDEFVILDDQKFDFEHYKKIWEEYYAWHTMRSQKNIISWKKMDAAKKYVEKESKKSK